MNIIDSYRPLTPGQITLLNGCVAQPFNLGKFTSLDDILTSLQVDVIIEPGTPVHPIPVALNAAEEYWREETNRLESLIAKAKDKGAAKADWQKAKDNLENTRKEKEELRLMPLRGLYDPTTNFIKLYPDQMAKEYNGTRMDELLVSTLAHETMHAYFNRPHHESFPYVVHVEEPLAEFGMLLYLHETGSKYYNWAYQDVSNKKTCYRYGAMLMDQHLNGNTQLRQYLEAYKIELNGYPMPTVSPVGGTILMPTSCPIPNMTLRNEFELWLVTRKGLARSTAVQHACVLPLRKDLIYVVNKVTGQNEIYCEYHNTQLQNIVSLVSFNNSLRKMVVMYIEFLYVTGRLI